MRLLNVHKKAPVRGLRYARKGMGRALSSKVNGVHSSLLAFPKQVTRVRA
jgi:hypothetical protein